LINFLVFVLALWVWSTSTWNTTSVCHVGPEVYQPDLHSNWQHFFGLQLYKWRLIAYFNIFGGAGTLQQLGPATSSPTSLLWYFNGASMFEDRCG